MKKTEFDSLAVLIGEVKAIGEVNNAQINKLFGSVDSIKNCISDLPCDVNGKRLLDLESWTKGHNNTQKTKETVAQRGRLNLKNGVIITLVGFGCSAAGSGLTIFIQHLIAKGG